jgi:hypothetical protein
MNVASQNPEVYQVSERDRSLFRRSEHAVHLLIGRRQNFLGSLAADLAEEDFEVVGGRKHEAWPDLLFMPQDASFDPEKEFKSRPVVVNVYTFSISSQPRGLIRFERSASLAGERNQRARRVD